MHAECNVEEYDPTGGHRDRVINADPSSAGEIVEALRGAWASTLRIPGDHQVMFVSFSRGLTAVMLAAGDGFFYDFVASEPQEGSVDFVHGGQLAEHPRRHSVSTSDALACVVAFLESGSVPLPGARWERQGERQIHPSSPTAA